MNIDRRQIEELVTRPSESLSVEIKRWIDPATPDGAAKLVKASFAIRNRNGGFILIGFDYKSLQPQSTSVPSEVRTTFHIDRIQELISRYASESFEVGVGFGERAGREYPVIYIPSGVHVPVAAKRDLMDAGKLLIRYGEVYFRTLSTNGRVSTAVAQAGDWGEILNICFENRDADVGRFLRRHLAGLDLAQFAKVLQNAGLTGAPPVQNSIDEVGSALDNGQKFFWEAINSRDLTDEWKGMANSGSWEVALIIDPKHEEAAAETNNSSTPSMPVTRIIPVGLFG